jgi:RNA polymerase sigma-70 factor, ECF subfamily
MAYRQGSDNSDASATEVHASGAERWAVLMARAQDGHQHDYRVLLEEIAPYLRGVCRRSLGRDEEVEDVVQDILLTVHRIRHTYERGRPFKPWLHTIAQRRIVDWMRQRARRTRIESDGRAMSIEERVADAADSRPDAAAMRARAAQEVRDAIDALPPRQRAAVVLLHLRGLTPREAAGITKQSAGALKVAGHRALKALKLAFTRARDDD